MGREDSPLVIHARSELQKAGLFDEDSDYGGALGKSVMELVYLFSGQGHSGASATLTLQIFLEVAAFNPLTPITDDPAEWQEVTKEMLTTDERIAGKRIWQSRRAPSIFSKDGGKTWVDMSAKLEGESLNHKEIDKNGQPKHDKNERAGEKTKAGTKDSSPTNRKREASPDEPRDSKVQKERRSSK